MACGYELHEICISGGRALTLVCMTGIVQSFRRAYDRQAALEENRRDFINAMAHEL